MLWAEVLYCCIAHDLDLRITSAYEAKLFLECGKTYRHRMLERLATIRHVLGCYVCIERAVTRENLLTEVRVMC
jgi:hypothetical protein